MADCRVEMGQGGGSSEINPVILLVFAHSLDLAAKDY